MLYGSHQGLLIGPKRTLSTPTADDDGQSRLRDQAAGIEAKVNDSE
jgi:hypothetical protein